MNNQPSQLLNSQDSIKEHYDIVRSASSGPSNTVVVEEIRKKKKKNLSNNLILLIDFPGNHLVDSKNNDPVKNEK